MIASMLQISCRMNHSLTFPSYHCFRIVTSIVMLHSVQFASHDAFLIIYPFIAYDSCFWVIWWVKNGNTYMRDVAWKWKKMHQTYADNGFNCAWHLDMLLGTLLLVSISQCCIIQIFILIWWIPLWIAMPKVDQHWKILPVKNFDLFVSCIECEWLLCFITLHLQVVNWRRVMVVL